MKKTMLAVFAAGLLLATPSCKKGENDSALSLKSRKSRLTAEWTVASYVETSTSTQTYMDDPNNDGDMLSSTNVQSSTFMGTEQSYTNTNSSTYDGQGFGGITASSSETAAAGAVITTSYTSTGTNGSVTSSNTGTQVVTIPPHGTIPFPTGTQIDIYNLGAGIASITGGTGVTLNGVSTGTGAMNAQYAAVTIFKIADNTWLMTGAHAVVA